MNMFDADAVSVYTDIAKGFAFFITLVVAALAWARNHDPFSPVKLYLIYSTFFYLGIYFSPVTWETVLVYLLLLLSIAICLTFEPKGGGQIEVKPVATLNCSRLYRSIWLLSVPGILVKAYFIYDAGGLLEYLFLLSFRVKEWAGKGHLIIWFYILPALNLLYFSVLLTDKKRSRSTILGYCVHFLAFITIGLLTGSRSYIAISLLGMVVMYSFLVRAVPMKWVVFSGVFLVVLAGLIGAARNNFGNGTDVAFDSLSAEQKFETAQTSYGIIPLEIVFRSPDRELLLGSTYLSLLTNYIPRGLFPGKPDTGGIAFTKIYADDQWGGLSNLATGAVTEGIINFGMSWGIVIGLTLNVALLVALCFVYRALTEARSGGTATVFRITTYFYLVLGAARFSFSEFTDVFQSVFFYSLVPIAVVRWLATDGANVASPEKSVTAVVSGT